jgi:twitching motility two-component system response regulator PilH
MAKVLIVDDIRSELLLIANALRPHGYECLEASDGSQAYAIAKAEKPDVILLDVVMPGQDGFATCRQLKRDPATKDIPVIMVTSKGGDSDRFWGQKQGAAEYLTKPFSPEELVAAVRRFA